MLGGGVFGRAVAAMARGWFAAGGAAGTELLVAHVGVLSVFGGELARLGNRDS